MLVIHWQKNEGRTLPYTTYKKIIQNGSVRNLRAKMIKPLKENFEENLHGIGFDNDLFDNGTKSRGNKIKIYINWTSVKLRNFVHQTLIRKRKDKTATDWEKIFADLIRD